MKFKWTTYYFYKSQKYTYLLALTPQPIVNRRFALKISY